jgi:hypothetical protein
VLHRVDGVSYGMDIPEGIGTKDGVSYSKGKNL